LNCHEVLRFFPMPWICLWMLITFRDNFHLKDDNFALNLNQVLLKALENQALADRYFSSLFHSMWLLGILLGILLWQILWQIHEISWWSSGVAEAWKKLCNSAIGRTLFMHATLLDGPSIVGRQGC
jgi:hypothetical protein